MKNKHIVCFSGGEGSALVAIEVKRRFGIGDFILLNHNITSEVEDVDIKRFKSEVADYCGVPITYANMEHWDVKNQFDVVIEAGAFKVGTGHALCSNRMKTAPFQNWIKGNQCDSSCVFYYGFDASETKRITRRSSIMAAAGLRTDYPLALWPERTIFNITEVGINPPQVYGVFRHANCVGCLKAGMQHWYVVYCTRPDIWAQGLMAEDEIGYSILEQGFLDELAPMFERMRVAGIEPTEKLQQQTFWSKVRKTVPNLRGECESVESKPCECVV